MTLGGKSSSTRCFSRLFFHPPGISRGRKVSVGEEDAQIPQTMSLRASVQKNTKEQDLGS